MARDYYDVLGVSRDAGSEELQQAFRKLARSSHPDVNKDPGAEERFKEINEAYSVLSDPKLRKRYAREVARERENERELVTSAFLPVLDTIDRALEHAAADPGSIVEGIRTLRDQALAVVSGLGYGREEEPGVPFDPARHEVVGVVDADRARTPPGSVASVVRPGYGAPGRQLRPAAVTVAQRAGS